MKLRVVESSNKRMIEDTSKPKTAHGTQLFPEASNRFKGLHFRQRKKVTFQERMTNMGYELSELVQIIMGK